MPCPMPQACIPLQECQLSHHDKDVTAPMLCAHHHKCQGGMPPALNVLCHQLARGHASSPEFSVPPAFKELCTGWLEPHQL